MARYGYARVSTIDQNLDRQILQLKQAGVDKIYQEKITGMKRDREQLDAVLAVLQPGDELVILDTTRISRSTKDLLEIFETIKNKGAYVHSIKESWFNSNPDNPYTEFLVTVMAGLSQLERKLTLQRAAEGRAAARMREDYRDGRPPKYKNSQKQHAIELIKSGMSYSQVSARTGMSRTTIYRAVKQDERLRKC